MLRNCVLDAPEKLHARIDLEMKRGKFSSCQTIYAIMLMLLVIKKNKKINENGYRSHKFLPICLSKIIYLIGNFMTF